MIDWESRVSRSLVATGAKARCSNPQVAHNSGFAYRFLPDGRIERRETWTENGQVSEEWNTLQPTN